MNLFYSKQVEVEKAYIITMKGNEISERYSKRCQESCDNVGMDYEIWDAYNGIDNPISVPDQCKNSDYLNLVKLTNHHMTRGEIACTMSHISLWLECAKLDKPIVILEHDAIMLKKFTHMENYNSIVWLGGPEWTHWNWPMQPIPPFGSEGPNNMFILRAHAYAIDPTMAKNLLAHVLQMGMYTATDVLIRTDLFHVTHQGLYAINMPYDGKTHETTILNRLAAGEARERNDNLEY